MSQFPSYVRRHRAQIVTPSDPRSRPVVRSPRVAHPLLLSHIGDGHQEHAIVMGLDLDFRLISHELVHKGVAHMVPMDSRDILRRALAMGANAIVIAHNHPSGLVKPSGPDIEATKAMVKAGAAVNVPVLDHLIFNHHEIYSMKEHDREHPCWAPPRQWYQAPDRVPMFDPTSEEYKRLLDKLR